MVVRVATIWHTHSILSSNMLSGALSGLDPLIDLETLDIQDNRFNGSIPSVIADLDQLEEFLAGDNYFSG